MSKFDKFSKSNNPMLKDEVYQRNAVLDEGMVGSESGRTMTVSGAVNKTFILFAIMLGVSAYAFMNPSPMLMIGGSIGGFLIYLFTSFNPSRAPITAPLYAVAEGLLVGAATSYYSVATSGLIFNAVTLTMAILFMMLTLYKSGLITVTDKFRAGVSMAVGAVMLLYLITFVLHLFGVTVPFLHDGGPFAIGLSAVIIGIASLNLLLDFDSFDKGEAYGAPEYMEWYSAMGLLFTLVWLYLEILRLLSYLSND